MGILDRCRICDGAVLEPCLDLGHQPWANDFLTAEQVGQEPRYPLRLVFCRRCRAAQLDFTVPKEVMFAEHTYLSGVTTSLGAHFGQLAGEVHQRFLGGQAGKRVLDIGSNDGTQLLHYQALGHQVLGVEPAGLPQRLALERGIPTRRAFFNRDLARDLLREEGGSFDVINAAGVFFHLEELHSAAQGIHDLLARDGVFVVQCLYMKRIVENGAFDQIYHEHLLYYTVRTLQALLGRHDLHLQDARVSDIHGGSLIAFVRKRAMGGPSPSLTALQTQEDREGANELATYQGFAGRIATLKEQNLSFLQAHRQAGRRIFGMGAPVKGNTLLNHFGIGTDLLDCLVERNVWRRGRFSPGMHIPVLIEDELATEPDVYYVLAWNFREEILARQRRAREKGVQFFFPLPAPLPK